MRNFVLLALQCTLFSGCLLYDCGYTPNDDTVRYRTDSSNKVPITYSLVFSTCFPSEAMGTPTSHSVMSKIDETLKACDLFSEVSYAKRSSSGYHIEFMYRDDGYDKSKNTKLAYLYVYTLFMIPIPEDYCSDLSAVVYLEGKPIWTSSHTEKCRYVVCWYALPAGMVMNYWSVWRAIEYNLVKSVVNDFTREHVRRFMRNMKVDVDDPNVDL